MSYKYLFYRYIAMTAKHHEAYTLWPSSYSFNWNSMDVGLKRDVLGEAFMWNDFFIKYISD